MDFSIIYRSPKNGLSIACVLVSDLLRIYAKNGIVVDEWPYRFRNLRGAFINDPGTDSDGGEWPAADPKVFTMAHELKHFFRDRDLGVSYCDHRT
jgi:hypothetical protein